MNRLLDKLTYANVISTLCLVLLLGGGTAYAAAHLGKNSVGSKQIKNGAVTPVKLSKTAKAKLTGPQGKEGPRGATGSQGTAGPATLPPSASASVASNQALTGTPEPIAQTTITLGQQGRIEESTVAVFNNSAAGDLTCEARIAPAGGSSATMGNPITLPIKASSAEGTAGGAALEPAGTYTVSVDCSTTGSTNVVSADMNVTSGAP